MPCYNSRTSSTTLWRVIYNLTGGSAIPFMMSLVVFAGIIVTAGLARQGRLADAAVVDALVALYVVLVYCCGRAPGGGRCG